MSRSKVIKIIKRVIDIYFLDQNHCINPRKLSTPARSSFDHRSSGALRASMVWLLRKSTNMTTIKNIITLLSEALLWPLAENNRGDWPALGRDVHSAGPSKHLPTYPLANRYYVPRYGTQPRMGRFERWTATFWNIYDHPGFRMWNDSKWDWK